ncbi:MAG: hypothetical protein SX243_04125 [Acidobacteriota bacterium]|nr:hypothetical protein [Acidobacteriota bacterium]
MVRMLVRHSVFAAVLLCWLVVSPAAEAREIVSVDFQRIDNLIRLEAVVEDGDAQNRFTFHHVRRLGPTYGSVILLPGGNANFDFYEIHPDGYDASFVGVLAAAGYDVFGYSPRSRGLPATVCQDGTFDCSVMADWGFETILRDLDFVRFFARLAHPRQKPVVGGFSLGAITALAAIDARPHAYSGALIWEGMTYSDNSQVVAANQATCTQIEALIAAGSYADAETGPLLETVTQLAVTVPDDPSPFEPALTNRLFYLALLTTPQPAPPAYVPGYTLVAGDLFSGFTYASEPLLQAGVVSFNDIEARAVARDLACSLAGDRTFTGNLGSFQAPVLAIGAEHGFGSYMQDVLDELGSSEVEFILTPDYAHADQYASPDRPTLIDQPLLDWLSELY